MGVNELIQVGNQIRKYRKKRGLSQKDVSKMTGIPYSTYSNYENNNREPSMEQLQKIATALQVSVNDFTEIGYVMDLIENRLRVELNGMELGVITQRARDFLRDDEYELLQQYYMLNEDGRREALKRVEELTEIKRYQSDHNMLIPENIDKRPIQSNTAAHNTEVPEETPDDSEGNKCTDS